MAKGYMYVVDFVVVVVVVVVAAAAADVVSKIEECRS
jgi:hypothetical protein